jgi:hypothetical protein
MPTTSNSRSSLTLVAKISDMVTILFPSILNDTIDQLCDVVRTAYFDNRSDPAVVGKKQAAYLACYQVVLLKLARMGKLAG